MGKPPGFYANVTASLRDFYGAFMISLPAVCHTPQRQGGRRLSRHTHDGRYALRSHSLPRQPCKPPRQRCEVGCGEIASTETWPAPGGDGLGVECTTTHSLVTHGAQGESSWLLRSTKHRKSCPAPAQMWSVLTPTMVLWPSRPGLP